MAMVKAKAVRNEAARKCWDEIGKVILGRANQKSEEDFTYQPGMSLEDIMAAFTVKK
ncbi:hypothetical protein [Pectobacterium aroidearum]|uniref:hypothetical protein n=1 Tax=Pectobacterium aroidearum TaxID=1201031 RepID=UPI001CD3C1B1|nr:hypothetical protein [Pectobacterium aroidearum]